MAPAASKANYKSYEAQARMVRAIVAAHPDVKWNYKEIAACYGSDMTEHALNHRFRRLRAQALIVHEARVVGLDMKDMMTPDDLPNTKEAVEKNNIAKYFGQSTPDGIQFQFRGIKHDADKLRAVEAAGGDVANCLNTATSTPVSTPSKPTAARSGAGTRSSGTGRKRTRLPIKRASSDDDDKEADIDGAGDNWSDRDDTPSKRPRAVAGQKPVTPRRAAKKAMVSISDAAAQLQDSASPAPIDDLDDTVTPRARSIFGPVDPAKLTVGSSDPYMGRASLAHDAWASALDMDVDDGYGDDPRADTKTSTR